PGARPVVDPPDRVAGRVLANAGESRRVLGQPGEGAIDAAPAVAAMEGRGRNDPRSDEEPRQLRSTLGGGLAREEVANRQLDGPQLVGAAALAAHVEVPGDPLERRERPGVAKDAAAVDADDRGPLADHDAIACGILRPQPGE